MGLNDWLIGLGAAGRTLGSEMTEAEIRRLALDEKEKERQRQQRLDQQSTAMNALNEQETLERLNYRPAPDAPMYDPNESAEDRVKRAMETHAGDQVVSSLNGKRYMRAPGDAPFELKQELQAQKEQAARELAVQRAEAAMQQAKMYEEGRNSRWGTESANNAANNTGAEQRVRITVDGANQRAANAIDAQQDKINNKPPTDAAQSAQVFAGLMQGAEQELSQNPWRDRPFKMATEIALKGDGSGLVGNAAAAVARARMSPDEQRAYQSRVQFTRAGIYAFSGKAVTDKEAAALVGMFFPQSGESDPQVAEQKRRSRALAQQLLSQRVSGKLQNSVPLPGGVALPPQYQDQPDQQLSAGQGGALGELRAMSGNGR